MQLHLSQTQIRDYLEDKISSAELLGIDDHLAACEICSESMLSASKINNELTLMDQIAPDQEHLPYDAMESYVNDTLDHIEREIADVHLERCIFCSRQVDELAVLREELLAVSGRSDGVNAQASIWANISSIARTAFLVPAFGLLISGAFGYWWFILRGENNVDQVSVPQIEKAVPPILTDTVQTPPMDFGSTPGSSEPQKPPEVVAALNDGAGVIELFTDGKLTGLKTTQFDARIRNALTKQEISIPTNERDLTHAPGLLMGGGTENVPFALTSPVGAVIEAARPRLKWKRLEGAESYRVEVFDENYGRVASSQQLRNTEWQVGQPLSRGRVYVWQVIAIKDGVETRSPVRPAPDAKFKVIDAAHADALASARKSGGSHLILGILYAEAGMLEEAQYEFRTLLRLNPHSDTIRKLLLKVQAGR